MMDDDDFEVACFIKYQFQSCELCMVLFDMKVNDRAHFSPSASSEKYVIGTSSRENVVT